MPLKPHAIFAAFLAAASMILVMGAQAWAYKISPVRMEIAAEAGARGVFQITNTQSRMIAVQARVYEQFQGREPVRVHTPDDFIITPPQMVIEPGQTQTVRIQWIADRPADREIAYRVIFEQVPVPLVFEDDEDVSAYMDAAYTYETAVYVSPRGTEAAVRLDSVEHVDVDGEPRLRVTLSNTGSKRTNLVDPVLTLRSADGESLDLVNDQLGPLAGALLLADGTATVDLPWPEGLAPGAVDGEFNARLVIV
ncbi:MAG: fimbrial biogenesis chaperone [Oceanicaulis sp.]